MGEKLGSVLENIHITRTSSGKFISRLFVCSKEGVRTKDKRDHLTKYPRAETGISCYARMNIKLVKVSDKYRVV